MQIQIAESAARPMLNALLLIRDAQTVEAAHDIAAAAIEYATGEHAPEAFELEGYEVDAAGAFNG